MKQPERIVVGLGEILWDQHHPGRRPSRPTAKAPLIEDRMTHRTLGGAPANFAYHAQVLGAAAFAVTAVADDSDGKQILSELKANGVSRLYVASLPHASHNTGTVDVWSGKKPGENDYEINAGAWDALPLTPKLLELARKCECVCFGSLGQRSDVSRQTIRAFLAATQPGCLRVFDINIRQSYYSATLVDESLQHSTLFKLNDEELPLVKKLLHLKGDTGQVMQELMMRYPLVAVALTRGAKGSELYVKYKEHKPYRQPAYPVKQKQVYTVGAGDSFTAALAVGLLRGDEPMTLLDRANRLASFVCTQPGGMPPVPRKVIK